MAKETLTKAEKQQAKLDAKREKANAKKKELAESIAELKTKIADSADEKEKAKLRKQRDELIAQRDGIARSKDGMTIPLAPNTKKTIRAVVAVVIVLAILCTYFATGTVRHGLLSNFGAPQSTFTAYTIADGDGNKHSVKVSTYNYYFAMQYNNLQSTKKQYEQYNLDLDSMNLNVDFDKKLSKQTTKNHDDETVTWLEYIQEEVEEGIKSTYLYYYEALKANDGKEPEITEDQQKELDEALDNYKKTAEGYGFTLSGYLTAAMGKGVTEEVFRREAKIAYIAENYQKELTKNLQSKEYSDKEYNDYKKDNYDNLVTVDIKFFECETEDDAKAFKKALKNDGSNFAELASKYSKDKFEKKLYKDEVESSYVGMTRPILKNLGAAIATADEKKDKDAEDTFSGLDWLFSSKRKAGEVKQTSTSVVYVVKPAYMSKQTPVTIRHILIAPTDEKNSDAQATEMSDKLWNEAKKKAEKVLAEFKKGEKTSAAFAKLAEENSTDGNASNGGIYENVTPNQMVPSFNAWCFDSARKTGDTAIVKTKFGYHIMYFESKNTLPVWKYTAQQSLANDENNDTSKKLEESYTIKKNWFGSRYFQKDTDIDS